MREFYSWRFDFWERGDFEAVRAAEQFLAEAGFSVGRMQKPEPRGILFGDFDIQKWRNLNQTERDELHGTMTGGRDGPVRVHIRASAPPEAHAALYAANERLLAGRTALARSQEQDRG